MEGEKISGDHVISVMSAIFENLSRPLISFSAVPIRPKHGAAYYGILMETDRAVSPDAERQLAAKIDTGFCTHNMMYRQKRADGSLAPVQLLIAAPGSFTAYAHAQGALHNTGDTQHKQPVILSSDALSHFKIERTVTALPLAKSA